MALHLKPLRSNAHSCFSSCSRATPARGPGPLFFPLASSSPSSLRRPSSVVQLRRSRNRGNKRKTTIGCVASSSSARSEAPSSSSNTSAAASAMAAAAVRVTAVATIKVTVGGFLNSLRPSRAIDDVKDLIGRSLYLELVSSQLDAKTGQEKPRLRSYAHKVADNDADVVTYEADFDVPPGFGEVGAVLVTNEHHTEMFLEDVNLYSSSAAAGSDSDSDSDSDNTDADGARAAPLLAIRCKSWVEPKSADANGDGKRVFFANKPYLPGQTPPGLRRYRNKDLEQKRGDGRGERKASDRIYDYDTYNDLGDPDSDDGKKARPVLGGSAQFPYPRRCRTGRPMSATDPKTETRSGDNYVPRDEAFSEVKNLQFSVTTLRSVLHAAVPAVQSTLIDPDLGFPSFFVIDKLFEDGVELPKAEQLGFLRSVVPRLLQVLRDGPGDQVLLFDTPANVQSVENTEGRWWKRLAR